MKKTLLVCMLTAALVCAYALPNLIAADAPADGLKMDKTPKPVVFNHSTHKDDKCTDCHHSAEDAANPKKCSSAGCHDVMGKEDKSEKSYYQAMHKMTATKVKSCLACHKEKAGADVEKKKALTACAKSKCHP